MSLPPLRRVRAVAGNAAASYLPPLLGGLVSLLVVRRASVEVWGSFVTWAVPVHLLSHVASWGNKDYLLRELARTPSRLTAVWQSTLVTRLAVALPVAAVAAVAAVASGAPPALVAALGAWLFAQTVAQSFDVLVLYRRTFALAVAVETLGFLPPLATVAVLASRLDLTLLAAAFALGASLRAAAWAVVFRRPCGLAPRVRGRAELEPRYFAAALPFFLLTFSGMLMSRTDLYCVAALLNPTAVGTYQVLTSFLLALQGLAALVVTPWVKALYRLPTAALWRTAGRLTLLGIAVTAPATLVLAWLLAHLYRLDVAPSVLVVGAIGVLPAFPSLALIYLAFRGGRQAAVVRVNLVGAGVNLGLNLALLPVLGMLGAVAATTVAQLAMLVAHLVRERHAEERLEDEVSELR